jgi:serine/threonine-protein kinase
MAVVCPRCQAQYEEPETRFCGRCGSDMNAARPSAQPEEPAIDMLIGRVVDGRYRILSKIGQGGMGAVYQVEHLAMGKIAAMKILHPALGQDPELAARFRREAEAVSRLSHPNTVQVFDFGHQKGFMYLVMELVRGEDLGAILRRDGALSFSRARPILMQVCDALSEAHEAGIVHRDLKPENLLVSRGRDGRDFVKVLDFGLAKLRDSEVTSQVTARGSLVGTPFYMSPEQIRAEDLDGRADIYSAGALLYRMVTGFHPFTAATPVAVLTQHLTDPLVLPSLRRPDLKIAPIVDQIVGRAMAKDRNLRFASADELRRALDGAPHVSQQLRAEPDGKRAADATGKVSGEPSGLKREDVDNYERSIKRSRKIGLAIVPMVLGLAALAFVLLRASGPSDAILDEEREPNDTAQNANPIANERTVRGHMGRCLTPEESDRDFYRLHSDQPHQVLHADVTGIPGIDLKLTLFDGRGNKMAETDEGQSGDGEVMPNVRLEEAGDYYLSVREVWVQGKPAVENMSDWYTLTARWAPLQPNQEAEPDDAPNEAVPLPLEEPMRGFVGRAGDVDYYYPRGEGGGTLSGTLSGIDGVDLRIVVLPPGATDGPPRRIPPGAKVFDSGGSGAPEKFDGIAWPSGSPGPILVVERREQTTVARKPGGNPLVGLDVPYSLTVRLLK